MSEGKHYGHDEGAWFWGCSACNPVESDKLGGELHIPAELAGPRVDWYCTVCNAGMTTWHGTALASCGHCGQTESPLVKVVVEKTTTPTSKPERHTPQKTVVISAKKLPEIAELNMKLDGVARRYASETVVAEARKTLLEAGVPSAATEELIAIAQTAGEALRLLAEKEAEADVCPWDCDSCHDEDCPCERMGCAGEKE